MTSGDSWLDRLRAGATAMLGRDLETQEVDRFAAYLALLRSWQRVHRLVGRSDPAWIAEHVFVDSLAFVAALPEHATVVVDIGSGAGIPGIPMKIVAARLRITLVEARGRRVSFLRTVVRDLALTGVDVFGARAEALVPDFRGRFDVAVMRCIGSMDTALRTARDLVRPYGTVLVAAGPGSALPPGARAIRAGGTRHSRMLIRLERLPDEGTCEPTGGKRSP
jgi:16S rRNA (guanine527-N7)-methyltransferase